MKVLLSLFLFSCSYAPPSPSHDTYHVLVFSHKTGDNRPKIIKNCEPYSLKLGRQEIEMAIADFSNKGMYCQQNSTHIDYECTSAFRMVRAVLVQGNRECLAIPNESIIQERRSL